MNAASLTASLSLSLLFSFTAVFGCSEDVFEGADDGGDTGDVVADFGDAASFDGGTEAGFDGGFSDGSAVDSSGSDGSSDAAPSFKRVFVTSSSYAANFGSLAAADGDCANVASGKGLGGTWKAWLSSSTSSAASRFSHSLLPYELLDGTLVAGNWTALTSGTLAHAIDLDENMVVENSLGVWTGTLKDGSSSGVKTDTCDDWTTASYSWFGFYGFSNHTDSGWSLANNDNCGAKYSLYCIEQ